MEKDSNNQDYEAFVMLTQGAEAEIVEKKSRFIATVRPVASEAEAEAFIEEMKKKYYDARHNCSAFVIGSRAQITRSSDDGEPGGTAGRPMLEVLLGSGIRNAAAVVTRYFGGTLLGTGGLVRAYSGVLKEALEKCVTSRQHFGVKFMIRTDYNSVGKLQYLLAARNVKTEDCVYEADVVLTVIAPIEEYEHLCKEVIEATSARAEITELARIYFSRNTL
ncbi:MAG: YigZ family protein [Lachnospiraceae bacterium]|nr:YigZ family protein [Lachnospiraceae bacterium]